MSAVALLNEIRAAGIAVNVDGDRLHVEARPGAITADLRQRMQAAKLGLVELLGRIATMRAHLLRLAAEEGIPSSVVDRMTDADVAAYAAVPDFTDLNYRAHLRALHADRRMDAGMIPLDWGEPHERTCEGCGPVLLWEACPDVVKACPWCFRRKAGKRIPRPRVQVANGVLNGFTDKGVTPAMRETLRAMRGQS